MANEVKIQDLKVIRLSQDAIIEINVDKISSEVKNDIAKLNISKMAATEENKQTLKKMRTKLNKKITDFENERKAITKQVNEPIENFKKDYDIKIKKVIQDAVKELGDKIDLIETSQIEEKKDYGRKYFKEKLVSMPINDANTFEDAKVSISVNETKPSIRKQIDAHFEKIKNATSIIEANENKVRLKALWISHNYDIGTALVELSNQLLAEQEIKQEEPVEEVTQTPVYYETKPKKPQSQPLAMEEVFDFKLKVTVTESQFDNLVKYMIEQEIDYDLEEVE